MLSLTDVHFGYKDRLVLKGISFDVTPGKVIGLIGPNGSGKSTIVKLAVGLLFPDSGSIALDGKSLHQTKRRQAARRIAMIPQEAKLPAGMNGLDAVLMGRAPYGSWLSNETADDLKVTREAMREADADYLADRPIESMSGGERRRLIFARAIAQDTPILLMDEPVAHLDIQHQVAMLEVVRRRVRERNTAVLGVFHEINLASEFCDEILVLHQGRIYRQGTPNEVLTQDCIGEVFGIRLPLVIHPTSERPSFLYPSPEIPSCLP